MCVLAEGKLVFEAVVQEDKNKESIHENIYIQVIKLGFLRNDNI